MDSLEIINFIQMILTFSVSPFPIPSVPHPVMQWQGGDTVRLSQFDSLTVMYDSATLVLTENSFQCILDL